MDFDAERKLRVAFIESGRAVLAALNKSEYGSDEWKDLIATHDTLMRLCNESLEAEMRLRGNYTEIFA